ncbi:hypothetical protein [Ectothiorhodospira shaposhnikovii]|uniref:hypothetical protein n=1 Tax=Ectothiorhodospira shaposhnikovii TaxID=1054 RepID=UPI001904D3D4|nr:hypothetical protein [Ectothiorhodospira shaposhnikovii]
MKPQLILVRIHALAGLLAMLIIATFWVSTLISELFLSFPAVIWVKQSIVWGLFILIPLLMITGGSGFALSKKEHHPLLAQKQRRMPFITLNGLLVLIPAAIYLSWKAQAEIFDVWFYTVQVLELIAGGANFLLLGLNARDGTILSKPIKPDHN